jgi:predicted acetyltransferase
MIEVRELGPADVDAAWRQNRTAFGSPDSGGDWFRSRAAQGLFIGAYDGAELVGVTGLHPYRQWYAGRDLPMTGLASVSVAPHARGRGVAKALLAESIVRAKESGAAVSVLFPSSPPVYRSMGWEIAGVSAGAELPTGLLAAVREPASLGGERAAPVTLRPVDKNDLDTVHALYTAWAQPAVGPLTRTGPLFDRTRLLDLAGVLLAERDGAPAGYVAYDRSDPGVVVYDLVGGDPAVLATLLRAVGSWQTVAPSTWLRVGDPAPLALLLPGKPPLAWQDNWMVRLIDAPAAVAGRGWRAGVRVGVDLELTDPDAPWHAGRWRLNVVDGSGTLERGGTGAVRIHIRGLSALFTGFASTIALRAVGLVEGDGVAAAGLDAAFAGQLPWIVDYF